MTTPELPVANHVALPRVDERESLWVRVGLTVAWVFFLAVVAAELKSAYEGRLVLASTIMLGPLGLVAILQGFLLRGWPRRIASWCLLPLFILIGGTILTLFMVVPPRWFPVVNWWIIALSAWGMGIVWWRGGMRRAVIAWCALPVVVIASLALNRGEWNGTRDQIDAGSVAMGGAMDWFAEDPDVFVVVGMEMPTFGNMRMKVETVGAVESSTTIPDFQNWSLTPQRMAGHAVVAKSEYGTGLNRSTIHYGTIAADGTMDMGNTVEVYGLVQVSSLVMFETGGPWRVLPRAVAPGDPGVGASGVTFLHRETGTMIHNAAMNHEWVFPTDDPDRFVGIAQELKADATTQTSTVVLLLVEIDLFSGGRTRELARHETPHAMIDIEAGHPSTGVMFAALPAGATAGRGTILSVEHLDWETGARTVVAQNVTYENVQIASHGEAMCVLQIDWGTWGSRLRAHDGRRELGSVAFHPADVLRDVALSPDGERVALVVGRGAVPGMIAQVYATQMTLLWEFENGKMTEINAQSVASGMMGFAPAMGGEKWHRLKWSRDGERLAHFSMGIRPFSTFNQWGGNVFVYRWEERGKDEGGRMKDE